MPHMSSGGSEDFYSKDEVKVYKDEGDEEKRSSENLSEEKFGLVTESEEGKNGGLTENYQRNDSKSNSAQPEDDKSVPQPPGASQGPLGFFVPSPYPPYPNGTSMGSKLGLVQPPYPGLVMEFGSPPPAHMGIPPLHSDAKTGLPRPPMYAYPTHPGQFPPHLYGPELSSVHWHRPPGYPISSGAFSSSYTPLINSSISRFGPPALIPHPGMPPGLPPSVLSPGMKQEPGMGMPPNMCQDSQRHGGMNDQQNYQTNQNTEPVKKKPHIKKPLNAFMLFMKEMRPMVIKECTLRESAAINQILGRRWHALDRAEQSKYYDMARKEKELHLQLYPGWSARDNYASHNKKKKRKKENTNEPRGVNVGECTQAKKCRARYGMEQQTQWCKPCRRKKKCVRYKRGEDATGSTDGEDMDDDDDDDDDMCSDSLRSGIDSDSAADSPAPASRGDSFHVNSDICQGSPLQSSPFLTHQKDELSHNMDKILDFHEGTKLFMDLPKHLSSMPAVPNNCSQPSVHVTQIST
ncbi:protein pangolin, isoforms A/H/I/S-like isoform X2 [Gigantopelta aegis]|uniref:protein pangolin, isoforms A/H/I/S-like isoform X2 n=1 Tax=Gigantopelta aegis TaxID=1735272 RepID=UPI001B88DF34|nr:protein pangolin, isoforms A/H/I/S-like isoform X2 [Gigantopelta aegis]